MPIYKGYYVNLQGVNQLTMKKKILFIMNPISGTSSKAGIPGLIENQLDKDKYDYEIRMTEYAGHGAKMAQDASGQGFDIVVAVGGDGTVNEVARGIARTQTALGILPCGSGNGLARHLMLPMNIKKSIQVLNQCEIHDLDYGLINGHPFFCTCGMGFDALISMKFAEAGKRGLVTYAESVLKEWLRYKPQTYELIDDTGTKRFKAFVVSCANASQYGNNAYIAPQASMSDGLMDVVVMEPFDLIEASQIAIELFNKTLDKDSKIKTFKCRKLHIHRQAPGEIHFDGDPVMEKANVDVEIVPKGIKVVVNPWADKRQRKPNVFQNVAADLFAGFNDVRAVLRSRSRQIQALNKVLQRKLNL